jgi:predicted Rossmann fold nucleotide-binding protein DprA/Smf involved in DNA uptake
MKIGIVGSRRRECEEEVRALIRSLPREAVIVSGGANGVDTWAVDEASRLGMATEVFRPVKQGPGYGFACKAMTERNRKIAESVDVLYAFVAPDRKGGAEQTVKFAGKLGVEVRIV